MGTSYDVICKQCGKKYTASFGPGMLFDLLHCDRCGRERIVSACERPMDYLYGYALDGPKGRCRCGGRFHSEAPPRCPSCKSAEFEEDPEGMRADFD